MNRAMIVACALLGAIGCSPKEASVSGRQQARGQPMGSRCAPDQLTLPCDCGGARGRQTCRAGAFTACECAGPNVAGGGAGGPAAVGGGNVAGAATPGTALAGDPPANRSSARFDWARTQPTGGSCEAGHYEGTFTGIYGPSIIVVADLKVIPVFPVPLPDNPGLAFDLLREGNGEIFTVSNGKMSGNALGAFPFTADVVGELNCETLKFEARLVNGSYFIGPLEYRFDGPITADYNKVTHTMTNGLWMVEEPDWPGAGGSGDWTVMWVRN